MNVLKASYCIHWYLLTWWLEGLGFTCFEITSRVFSTEKPLLGACMWFALTPDLGDVSPPPPSALKVCRGCSLFVLFCLFCFLCRVLFDSAFQVEADAKRRVWWWPYPEKVYFNAAAEAGRGLKEKRWRGETSSSCIWYTNVSSRRNQMWNKQTSGHAWVPLVFSNPVGIGDLFLLWWTFVWYHIFSHT